MSRRRTLICLVVIAVVVSAGSVHAQQPILLFDGTSFEGWMRPDGKPIENSWEMVDGMLHLKTGQAGGANLLTKQEFTDFDLEFDWKISPGGNNGLKYRVRKYDNQYLGIEYQILDDAKYDLHPRGMTGSLYELYETNEAKQLNPVGQFNHSRVLVRGNHIEHWLNGALIASAQVGSRDWYQRVSESKFGKYEGFGANRSGKLMLTDHGSEVWYRNIILTPLPPPVTPYAYVRYQPQRATLFRGRLRAKSGWRPLKMLRRGCR
jgi:hypothetical protein